MHKMLEIPAQSQQSPSFAQKTHGVYVVHNVRCIRCIQRKTHGVYVACNVTEDNPRSFYARQTLRAFSPQSCKERMLVRPELRKASIKVKPSHRESQK